MNDLISRAAVVDAIEGVDWYHINKNGEMVHGANDAEHQAWYKADDIYAAIERVPSAQPVAKDINVPVKDCISRQAAIDAMMKLQTEDIEAYGASIPEGFDGDRAVTALKALPSAQRWIPCSERLPSFDFTDVLVCMHDVRHGCEDEYYIASAYVVRGHWEMTLNVDTSDLEIVAWMPLPKPWKGGEE